MKRSCLLPVAVLCVSLGLAAWADEFATSQDAEALVKKAVAHIKQAGKQQAYADFTAKKPEYIVRDSYITIIDSTGKVMAHGQNEKLVGKEVIDLKDPDGKPFIREMVETAKTKDAFWVDYKFTDPNTKKILPKSSYCQKLEDTVVCAGVYKR